ncbi:MAG: hypothetical protein ABSA59_03315 [Terriglobia bacterium]|jgi:hypothetical protein
MKYRRGAASPGKQRKVATGPERRSLSAQQAAEPLVTTRPIERNRERLGATLIAPAPIVNREVSNRFEETFTNGHRD